MILYSIATYHFEGVGMTINKQVYTVTEVAKILGVSRGTAYECVKTNAIPHIKLGRRIVIPGVALEQFLKSTNQAF